MITLKMFSLSVSKYTSRYEADLAVAVVYIIYFKFNGIFGDPHNHQA